MKARAFFITSCVSIATCAVSFAVRGDVAGAMGAAFHLTNEQVGVVLVRRSTVLPWQSFSAASSSIRLGCDPARAVGGVVHRRRAGDCPRAPAGRGGGLGVQSSRHDAALRRVLPLRHRSRAGRVRHQSAPRVNLSDREDEAHCRGARVVAWWRDPRRPGDAGLECGGRRAGSCGWASSCCRP